ncbi:MAG: GDSL-type esterase/lipase family protein [Candidatus Pacebacteria bacterium]|nr:GDSL-type esterase/lipase family protein [Candidatus Paceibacterota bacterium]
MLHIHKFGKFQFLGIALVLIISALVIWYPRIQFRQDKIVVAFGDSLTRGYGVVPPERNYVVYLSDYIHLPIINAGHSGDTTSDALIRLQADVLDKKPDIAIVFLGGNDFFEGYTSEVIAANLKTIVHKIQSNGAKVILVGGDTQIASDYEKAASKIASDEKVFAYIPNVLNGILLRKDLMYDNVHPNEKGHEIIAQKLLPALQRALLEN